jgi:hypothetical protein
VLKTYSYIISLITFDEHRYFGEKLNTHMIL